MSDFFSVLSSYVPINTNQPPHNEDGEILWGWGSNTYGQVGDGQGTATRQPTVISELGWTDIACGDEVSAGIMGTGSLFYWGSNRGATPALWEPTRVETLPNNRIYSDWQTVACGSRHIMAIRNNGTLWGWGQNNLGQLGDGTTTAKQQAIQIGTDNRWKTISCGPDNSTIAIKTDGTLWGWGDRSSGFLLSGAASGSQTVPVQIWPSKDWQSVSKGKRHVLAIKNDGSLWSWGKGNLGEMGHGIESHTLTAPTMIGTDKDWAMASAGTSCSFAIKTDGSLWSWGYAEHGVTGHAGGDRVITSPRQLLADKTWKYVAGRDHHAMAITEDGNLWGWGRTTSVDGTGSGTQHELPKRIHVSASMSKVAVGLFHTISIGQWAE